MLETEERALLEFCLGTQITQLEFCNFRAPQHPPQIDEYDSFLAFNFGCKITVNNELSVIVSHWEDELGDPYRVKAWNYEDFNKEALYEKKVNFIEPWSHLIGETIKSYEILNYASSYNRHGQHDAHDVTWGVLFTLDHHQLLAAALSSSDPLQQGAHPTLLVSQNADFIVAQQKRFKNFVR
ncbi:hypothetical protein [uncultured Microscilla sp.]|uniref:hypothetical protein n=1 Tax=uncultured Microscilla sp. TaxID=432653 RepID=UPI002602B766|nr:hypothetical protein [uncultured Microscilla sp.]